MKTPSQTVAMEGYDALGAICTKHHQVFKFATGEHPSFLRANRDKNPDLFDAWWTAKDLCNVIDHHLRDKYFP